MRYLSFRDPVAEPANPPRAGIVDDGAPAEIHDVTDMIPAGPGSPVRRLAAAIGAGLDPAALLGRRQVVDRGSVTLLAPVPDPSKIVAAPVNYRDHQHEMSQASHIDALGVFLKAPSSLLADGGRVQLPYHDRRFDQEGEFAAVIGRPARHVDVETALEHVLGVTCLLDMTMRGGEDRSVRKSFDTFTPLGPSIVPLAGLPPIDELELHTWVNGTLRQRADLADLIWSLPRLIAYASSVMTLLPGDIVTTGTPAGVGEVGDGDLVEVEITGLDRLTVTVSAQHAGTCPTRGADRGPVPPAGLTRVSERPGRSPAQAPQSQST